MWKNKLVALITALKDKLKSLDIKKKIFSKWKKRRKGISPKSSSESRTKTSQKRVAAILAGFAVLVVVVTLKEQFIPSENKKKSLVKTASAEPTQKKLETVGDHINPEEMWRFKMSEEGQATKKSIGEIKSTISNLIKQNESTKFSDRAFMESRIASLEKMVKSPQVQAKSFEENKGIERIDIRLNNQEQEKIDTVDSVIPAGAFAKAVLLSGVDAPTALSASSDPLPLLIRITDPGTLPRKFKSDLKDCHLIVSGYGDLSSERVYTRLDRLTCTERATGEIVETEVSGFVTGEDGKAGMRGKVVAKEAGYLANSMIGGLVGGFSNTLSPQENAVPYILSGTPKGPSMQEKFQKGFGTGMSSSMDRLSKYYIDRAESLQPVIEVSPGRIVDVIFTAKAEIGSSHVKQEIAAKRNKKRIAAAKDLAKKDKYGRTL